MSPTFFHGDFEMGIGSGLGVVLLEGIQQRLAPKRGELRQEQRNIFPLPLAISATTVGAALNGGRVNHIQPIIRQQEIVEVKIRVATTRSVQSGDQIQTGTHNFHPIAPQVAEALRLLQEFEYQHVAAIVATSREQQLRSRYLRRPQNTMTRQFPTRSTPPRGAIPQQLHQHRPPLPPPAHHDTLARQQTQNLRANQSFAARKREIGRHLQLGATLPQLFH